MKHSKHFINYPVILETEQPKVNIITTKKTLKCTINTNFPKKRQFQQ